LTTFVAVCIPEFLSMYETERLTQDLIAFEIDIRNIVINQVLITQDNNCQMCNSRKKMQAKYISQIKELFEDFHITILPLMTEEVRGVGNLSEFSKLLLGNKEYSGNNNDNNIQMS
jgi:arsenite-transporting ATPase